MLLPLPSPSPTRTFPFPALHAFALCRPFPSSRLLYSCCHCVAFVVAQKPSIYDNEIHSRAIVCASASFTPPPSPILSAQPKSIIYNNNIICKWINTIVVVIVIASQRSRQKKTSLYTYEGRKESLIPRKK